MIGSIARHCSGLFRPLRRYNTRPTGRLTLAPHTLRGITKQVHSTLCRSFAGAAPTMPTISLKNADLIADLFVVWMTTHGLSWREWTVDDTWWLASEDFAVAHEVSLPPRRMFLGALQGRAGVTVTYDRRIGRPDKGKRRKTTFYKFADLMQPMKVAA